MKYILIIANLLYSFIANSSPDWVQHLRTGNSQMRIVVGKDYLFRNVYKNEELEESALCEEAINQNMENIKKAYPTVQKIPVVVQLVHFDKDYNDCSTTISLNRSLASKLEKLNHYATQNDELRKQNDLLKKKLSDNSILKTEQKRLNSLVTKFQQKKLNRKYAIKSNIYTGMTLEEVGQVLGEKLNISFLKPNEMCYNNYKSPSSLICGEFIICFSNFELTSTVRGVCEGENCWENK